MTIQLATLCFTSVTLHRLEAARKEKDTKLSAIAEPPTKAETQLPQAAQVTTKKCFHR